MRSRILTAFALIAPLGLSACAGVAVPVSAVPTLEERCHFYRSLAVDADPTTIEAPMVRQARAFVAAYCGPAAQ